MRRVPGSGDRAHNPALQRTGYAGRKPLLGHGPPAPPRPLHPPLGVVPLRFATLAAIQLMPTMKLKRALVNVKYKSLIDSMYQGSGEFVKISRRRRASLVVQRAPRSEHRRP